MKKIYTIGQTASIIGVSINTLRRWGEKGKLVAERSKGGHRYYAEENINNYLKENTFNFAKDWTKKNNYEKIPSLFHCPDSYVFKSRLDKFIVALKKAGQFGDSAPLLVAITGEIGNNAFDHNIGNWLDVHGLFFGYSTAKKQIVLADRGQGVLKTLKRIRPELSNNENALKVAFTEFISGRFPEKRGNGLKFVKRHAFNLNLFLTFQSGDAILTIKKNHKDLIIKKANNEIQGCLISLQYN